MIELRDLNHVYPGNIHAVKDLNLKIDDNKVCVLIGPSGCGKSTVLNMINKLIGISSGDILIDGVNIQEIETVELRRNIGYAIQEISLFPHKTVGENIATVPHLKKWDKEKTNQRVEELLILMGLEPKRYRDKYPSQLSGGEQQRVGVARALGANPPILLMDEPFGAVDPIARTRLQDEFLLIQEKINKTIVFVTHDIDEAIKMGDYIAILDKGELVQYGTPREILQNPVNKFVEEFMGEDRNVKGLQLTYVEEIIEQQDSFGLETDDYNTVIRKLEQTKLNSLPILTVDKKLIGYMSPRVIGQTSDQDWKKEIKDYNKILNKKTTVYNTMFDIMVDVNNYLPAVDRKNKYLGVVTQEKVNKMLRNIKDETMEVPDDKENN